MIAEIVAIGSELLTPFRQDTNSLYLTQRLNEMGVEVAFKNIVGDSRANLASVARTAIARSHIVLFMGGLGPTEDDLTREAVADALGLRLKRNPDLVAELYKRFASRRVTMPDNNMRQADVIAGAEIIQNDNGSAPGQFIEGEQDGQPRYIFLLPGPPHELKAMWNEKCHHTLRDRLPRAYIATRELRISSLGESTVDARVAPIYTKYKNVDTTILAKPGEVSLHLKSRAATMEQAQAAVDQLAAELEDELDDAVFSTNGESLEQIVGYYLQMRSGTISVAESCTGGLLAERLTNVSGSSRYFIGGVVVYSNQMKTLLADVPPLMIEEHGAVSRQVAVALAENFREITNSTIGVGITGIAGPTGGTEDKPVGLVYIAVADELGTDVVERRFPGDRERIRWWSSQVALDMVRKKLI
ncbi:competence/damage-inducible protein cinA [Candidatus Koribacter versatilis Ellin345]|uniref:CinA-like protein n=1 Tax=Koribacter versatilis (strain Ellin345) TaxID=204669 RepID=CINAL_KORVE|nr:competence/damage-inducible protein A [Candidatus Koribacter versatilis]Q1IPQ9.1 RecName: Full=CinA-like protein [Candidatus Koribacter versatilis Ellin345]ABF41141.1 competence/damage-inducible protein cinA [Candidatus Koribacter versatilis Ellin345]